MQKEDWIVMNNELAMIQTHDIALRVALRERLKMLFTGAFHLHADIRLKPSAFRIIKITVKAVRVEEDSHEMRMQRAIFNRRV